MAALVMTFPSLLVLSPLLAALGALSPVVFLTPRRGLLDGGVPLLRTPAVLVLTLVLAPTLLFVTAFPTALTTATFRRATLFALGTSGSAAVSAVLSAVLSASLPPLSLVLAASSVSASVPSLSRLTGLLACVRATGPVLLMLLAAVSAALLTCPAVPFGLARVLLAALLGPLLADVLVTLGSVTPAVPAASLLVVCMVCHSCPPCWQRPLCSLVVLAIGRGS